MKKLLGLYKGLPREVKMLIAMAGLGTPIGIFYFMRKYLFPGQPLWVIILIVAGLVAVIALLAFVISKIFGRSAKKRTKKMEAELASGAETGPISMDLRASIKSNNEKFFNAIKEMRKLGISVYDLPWYVVIGDSGCGKTKLINEGGLTFSTGKPEGYQLGTLNYNWWFTEDAIFVDMAGRLCNPQEDADRREWEAFLKTVGTGRKGYPINGVLACVSAEHLLQESPEQHEEDANTLLERLRDLQNKLGVTFATYLVITKCDRIVGFMQFFDRAERDITIKNQIFGWSRPGDFNELHDPERFGTDFDGVYGRLNELRLRRLNDDVDAFELGMAYSFPEEFRQLKEPLETYVRTLFPMIKHPRAVKNLIFRGVYLTSATQQGPLILRHLTQRLGSDAAAQFQPLESMYPRPRPHFVKDLLFRKVFPEEGLVFRNEQEVVRNRKLSRVLTAGTAALAVLLLGTLGLSSCKFSRLISEPRGRAMKAPEMVGKPAVTALAGVSELGQDVERLQGSIWPRVLSLGVGAGRPVKHLTEIQMRLFEDGVLRRVLATVDESLRSGPVIAESDQAEGGIPFDEYQPALEEYIAWYGCAGESELPEGIDYGSFEKLCGAIAWPTTSELPPWEEVRKQAERYFDTIHSRDDWVNPAALLLEADSDPHGTIRAGISHLHHYLERYAVPSAEHPDDVIREWMRVRDCCAHIQDSYNALLAAADRPIQTQEQLDSFREVFAESYTKLSQAMAECKWRGGRTGGFVRIPSLCDALKRQRQKWLDDRQKLYDAYGRCGNGTESRDDPVVQAIAALVDGDGQELRGLDPVLCDSLHAAGLSERGYFQEYFSLFDSLVREVDDSFAHVIVLTPGEEAANDLLDLTDDLTLTVRPVLDKVDAQLATLDAGDVAADTMTGWIATLERLLFAENLEATGDTSGFAKLDPRWQPEQLERLNSTYQDLIRKGTGTVLLRTIEARLQPAAPWGLGELAPEWRSTRSSAYHILVPVVAEARAAPKEATAPPPVTKPPSGPPPLFKKPKQPGAAEPPTAISPPQVSGRPAGAGQIPSCASPDFLNARALECVRLMRFLQDFGPRFYFARAADTSPLNERCIALVDAAWNGYCVSYVTAWEAAYGDAPLAELKRLGRWDQGWGPFASQFRLHGGTVGSDVRRTLCDEFQPALSEILHAIRWATYSPEHGRWLEQQDGYYDAQKRKVAALFDAAVRDHWTRGAFAQDATAARGGAATSTRPWDALAADFADRWTNWCDAVGEAAQLPQRFAGDGPRSRKRFSIPWRGITALREESGLRDERLTQQLVNFQSRSQRLLSAELTNILHGIQEAYFPDQVHYDGWPYLNKQGTGRAALQTLDFGPFVEFLLELRRAEAILGTLEQGLPEDDPYYRTRRAFVQAGQEWREFLSLDEQGGTKALKVRAWIEDPLAEPYGAFEVQDTAQFYYKKVRLTIGLRREAGDRASATPLDFPTFERGQAGGVSADWEWTRIPGQQDLTFELVDGIQPERQDFHYPPINPEILGTASPLAFCAYLHRYGRYEDSNWVVSHGVNLAEKFSGKGRHELVSQVPPDKRIVGEKFMFQLPSGRNLPEPIPKLRPASGVTPGGG